MRKVLAIARLTLQNAVRSRMVLALIFLLTITVLGIPLTIKGDGTLAGTFRILISYSISSAVTLLAIATLWGGCAAVSLEIEDRTLHLVVTKPVHRFQVWLGKWLGFLVLNLVLLVFTGVAVYGLTRWTLRAENLSPTEYREVQEELMVARYTVAPIQPNLEPEIERNLERRRTGSPQTTDEKTLREQITHMVRVKDYTVAPGASKTWEFQLPQTPKPGHPIFLQYFFNTSSIVREAMDSNWRFGDDPQAYPQTHTTQIRYNIKVPDGAVDANNRLTISLEHPPSSTSSLLVDPDDGIRVLYYAGRFEANLVRALLSAFCQLAVLAALGVTMGTLFSMPVAAFSSLGVIVIRLFSRTIESSAASGQVIPLGPDPGELGIWFNKVLSGTYQSLAMLMKPLHSENTLELLATGRLISWALTGRVVLLQLVIVCGLLGLIGAGVFKRREVGRPE